MEMFNKGGGIRNLRVGFQDVATCSVSRRQGCRWEGPGQTKGQQRVWCMPGQLRGHPQFRVRQVEGHGLRLERGALRQALSAVLGF